MSTVQKELPYVPVMETICFTTGKAMNMKGAAHVSTMIIRCRDKCKDRSKEKSMLCDTSEDEA